MLDLSTLNLQQREAVVYPLKPVLVSAGAGSGKTRVLSYRVTYLIESGQVEAVKILALTFTNKAAREMSYRLQELLVPGLSFSLTPNSQLPVMGTFHSIGVRVLREFGEHLGLPKRFTIFDDDDSQRLIKKIIKELEMPERITAGFLLHLISQAKSALIGPEKWQPEVTHELKAKIKTAYERYEGDLRKAGAVDFDDLLGLPLKLWREEPEVLEKFRKRFVYILVDEYQDTNGVQFEWLKTLRPEGNVFAVGDEAQSIYGFRGSSFENWQKFQREFKGCEVIHLEQNYRSTQNILDAAGGVLLGSGAKNKILWTRSGSGSPVYVREFVDDSAEALFVAKTVAKLAGGGGEIQEYGDEMENQSSIGGGLLDRYLAAAKLGRVGSRISVSGLGIGINKALLGNFAVLYRTHGQSRTLEEIFMSAGIPYRIIGGLRFYQRKEIKDALAVLRLLLNPSDTIALERVVGALPLGIGDKSLPHLADALSPGGEDIWDKAVQTLTNSSMLSRQRNGALKLLADLSAISQTSETEEVSQVLRLIIAKLGFREVLLDGTEQGEGRWENLQELINVAASRSGGVSWQEGADKLLEEAALLAVADEAEGGAAVQMMTIHAAKGLEFDSVFVTGLEEGLLPHIRSLDKPCELAEEVRLAYVAMTRARKHLYLTYARGRFLGGGFKSSVPSRFLRHLPETGVSWTWARQRNLRLPNHADSKLVYEAVEE